MSIVDPGITLAFELGNLSVKELELKKLQDEIEEAKQDILEKEKLLADSSVEKENIQRQVEASRQALKDAKSLIGTISPKRLKR